MKRSRDACWISAVFVFRSKQPGPVDMGGSSSSAFEKQIRSSRVWILDSLILWFWYRAERETFLISKDLPCLGSSSFSVRDDEDFLVFRSAPIDPPSMEMFFPVKSVFTSSNSPVIQPLSTVTPLRRIPSVLSETVRNETPGGNRFSTCQRRMCGVPKNPMVASSEIVAESQNFLDLSNIGMIVTRWVVILHELWLRFDIVDFF